jgi:hypothetical protein
MSVKVLFDAARTYARDHILMNNVRKALDTSLATVARIRQPLVEEGFDAVLTRKHSPNSARERVFDGAAEAN